MSLHVGFCRLIDPLQRLSRTGDGEQHFVGFPACAVLGRDFQRLSGQQQLVVASILCIPENDLSGRTVTSPTLIGGQLYRLLS